MLKNHSFSQSISQTWDSYETEVTKARASGAGLEVHALRVAIEKLEAILGLAKGLDPLAETAELARLIRKMRKSLGPLRDSQVEVAALKGKLFKELDAKKRSGFSGYIQSQRRGAQKKAILAIGGIRLEQEKAILVKIGSKIKKTEMKQGQGFVQEHLEKKMKKQILKVDRLLKELDPLKISDIHSFRILAKKIRDQGACLNELTGLARYTFNSLDEVLEIAGEIQNDSVLVHSYRDFFKLKGEKDDLRFTKLEKRIEKRRQKLVATDFGHLATDSRSERS